MKDYLNSKVADYSLLLQWLKTEMATLQATNTKHPIVFSRLYDELQELRRLYDQLETIAAFPSDMLHPRAIPIIHLMEYQVLVLTSYLPGLQRERSSDVFFREMVLSAKDACGLSWIEDILVKLDSPHAILPVIPEIPIVSAPPHHVVSTMDMAAIYHELGHDVFQHLRQIGDHLEGTVDNYFSLFKKSAGRMTPEKRRARDKAIDSVRNYWNIERLNEIFSDIYASYVCGPAYYHSCVDFVVRIGRNPFVLNHTDVHPPWAARIYACYKSLGPDHQRQNPTSWVQKVWDSYVVDKQKHPDFDVLCTNALIDQLVVAAHEDVERLLPMAIRYVSRQENQLAREEDRRGMSLERILNERVIMLSGKPSEYAEWEKGIYDILNTRFKQQMVTAPRIIQPIEDIG